MKKDYFYPETEIVQLESRSIMNGSGEDSGKTPHGSNPDAEMWE